MLVCACVRETERGRDYRGITEDVLPPPGSRGSFIIVTNVSSNLTCEQGDSAAAAVGVVAVFILQ